jgi:replicative DNA helicase
MIIHTKNNDFFPISDTQENIQTLCGHISLSRDGVICIASRPEMGKTALSLHMALEYAKKSHKTVYIFTMEMLAEQLYDRLLIMLSEVDATTFCENSCSPQEKERIGAAKKQLSKMNFMIDDASHLSVKQIEEKLKSVDNLGLVIIDYFQLLCSENNIGDREQEYFEIGRQLKILSMRRKIPIIFTSQLRRSTTAKKDKKPSLTELAGTGVLEHDQDAICFIHRKENASACKKQEEAEIIIPRNKLGDCGSITLMWKKNFIKFCKKGNGEETL